MKLKSLLTLSMCVFAASAFAGAPAKAPVVCQPEEPLGFTASIGYDSNYVFRGVNFANNLVSAAVDGTVGLNDMLSLNVGAWFGASADDSFQGAGGGSYNELDLYAAILADVGPATVGVKYTYYAYDLSGANLDDVNEIGLVLASTLGPVDVTAGAYYDFTAEGYYFETGVSHSFAITDRVSLVPAALVSYAIDYYGIDSFNHVKLALSLPIKLTKTATLTPYVAGNIPLNDLDAAGEDERIYGGVALSVSF